MNADAKEELRYICREVLATRFPTALPTRAVRRHAARELGDDTLNENDVEAACLFLVGLGELQVFPDPLGITRPFSATSAGVLAWERGRQDGASPRSRE